ncbi:hypothetical protein NX02_28000 [Sphingomonas sanxanigenens DSM 19645 = NX02]|uniref:Protein TonB n=2 Tax=Sphingomonas sanxanigenens TaxID=397260 RepID=W0ALJ4_9SPHN|nr:hypothetical protein NX02_28000 [Sphingomonas sanxanigenens DSM 19645 = NX02]
MEDVMTADGFLTNKRRSPVSLGAALAIQGVVLAGLLSMAPKIVERGREAITMIDVPKIEVPPPDPIDPPKPTTEAPLSRPTTPDQIVPTPADPVIFTDPAPLTPIPPGPIVGTGTAPFVEPRLATQPKPPVFVDAGLDPRYASGLQPPYPGRLQREQVEGKATVKVLIGTDGRVKAVQLVAADDPGFFKATEEQALRRWRFKPATRDGVAVESWKQMTVHFRLES